MKLSIIIPCNNERETLATLVTAVLKISCPDKEIIIVDDGSTDGTRDILKTGVESLASKVICHDHDRGKGAALRSGIRAATGDVVYGSHFITGVYRRL